MIRNIQLLKQRLTGSFIINFKAEIKGWRRLVIMVNRSCFIGEVEKIALMDWFLEAKSCVRTYFGE